MAALSRMTMAEQLNRPARTTSPALSQPADDELASSGSLSQEPAAAPVSSPLSSQAAVAAIIVGFKRPRDNDTGETLTRVARKLKLDNKESELLAFASKMPLNEQILFSIGLSLQTMTKVDQMQPADATFKLPEVLKGKIELYSYNALVSPQATGYLEDGARIVLSILKRHPKWGLTPEIKENPTHYHVVCSRVYERFNDRRRHIKLALDITQIAESMGTVNQQNPDGDRLNVSDIFTLVSNATKLKGTASMNLNSVNITVQMLARFAFLRRMLLELPAKANYWKTVDKQLQDIRKRFNGQPKQAISTFFKQILDDNLEEFGTNKANHLDDLGSAALTNTQAEVEDAMLGIISVLTNKECGQLDRSGTG
ncbi:hypothetical protein BC835DRAFT_1423243 [Cytidiella melzeri]|nr:hypothetical protein BC835DRAFT_1423243 [Cytidiella melzeri]